MLVLSNNPRCLNHLLLLQLLLLLLQFANLDNQSATHVQRLALLSVRAAVGVVHVSLAKRHRAGVESVADGDAASAAAGAQAVRGRAGVDDCGGERLGRGGADALQVAAGDREALERDGQLKLGDVDGPESGKLPRIVRGEVGAVLAERRCRVDVVAEGEAGEDAPVERAAVEELDAVRLR